MVMATLIHLLNQCLGAPWSEGEGSPSFLPSSPKLKEGE